MKNFCTPACAQQSTTVVGNKKQIETTRKVFTQLHNTLPRSSKSEDDLLSTQRYPEDKVKAAGYKPLVNQGGSSTTSEDTLKVETTSQRKTRPKLFRQKSFEIDSSDNNETEIKTALQTVQEVVVPKENLVNTKDTKSKDKIEKNQIKKKRPALTIKIQNSSFCDEADDLTSEFEKSPNIYISGILFELVLK